MSNSPGPVRRRALAVRRRFPQASLPELHRALRAVRLSGMIPKLELRALEVAEGRMSFLEALGLLVRDELDHRRRYAVRRRQEISGVPPGKCLEEFDWDSNPQLPKQAILELARLEFVANRQTVLLAGAHGLGRSHCAIALALLALQNGYSVLFRRAEALSSELEAERDRGELRRFWSQLNDAELLVIDDLLPIRLPTYAADHLAMVLLRRRDRLATLISSDLLPECWPVQAVPRAAPVLSRLITHARSVRFEGNAQAAP